MLSVNYQKQIGCVKYGYGAEAGIYEANCLGAIVERESGTLWGFFNDEEHFKNLANAHWFDDFEDWEITDSPAGKKLARLFVKYGIPFRFIKVPF